MLSGPGVEPLAGGGRRRLDRASPYADFRHVGIRLVGGDQEQWGGAGRPESIEGKFERWSSGRAFRLRSRSRLFVLFDLSSATGSDAEDSGAAGVVDRSGGNDGLTWDRL